MAAALIDDNALLTSARCAPLSSPCGCCQIVISWFLSPLAAAVVCLIIFLLVRTVVLRRPNSTKLAFYALPVLIIVTIWVVSALTGQEAGNERTASLFE
jgi:phosphate/sulfate permease